MQISNFYDLYFAELQELRSVTTQFEQALERMAEAASHPDLKRIFTRQRIEMRDETEELDEIMKRRRVPLDPHRDQAMEALVREAEKMLSLVQSNDLRDTALIGSAQRLEHYQIAAYGTAAELAAQLDLRDDEEALHAAAQKKKRADMRLIRLAKAKVNPSALEASM